MLLTEEFIRKAREIHGDKYDYSLVDYKGTKSKIKIICKIHGEFEQRVENHIRRKQGCLKCGIIKNSSINDDFIKKAKEIHGDRYDYSLRQQ
jgi:hypothetical protein